jgi:predicted metal-dependent hydrolase
MEKDEELSILLDGKDFICRIRPSRRAKRIRLTIEDDGRLLVTLPVRKRSQEIPPLLYRYRKWILKKTKETQMKKLPPPFEFRDGSCLKVLDRSYSLSLRPAEADMVQWRFDQRSLIISSPRFSPSLIYRCVELWYRRMAQLFLDERVPFWAERLQVKPKAIRVKNQSTLWGSCSVRNNLNFNWRIMLLSQQAADYLIIHELAHLKQPNHSPEFWKLVENNCPEYRKHKNEIKDKNPWLKFPGHSVF